MIGSQQTFWEWLLTPIVVIVIAFLEALAYTWQLWSWAIVVALLIWIGRKLERMLERIDRRRW